MPSTDQIAPTRLKPRRRFNARVVTLAYDGLCAFEFACATEVFGLARPEFSGAWYRFETCSSGGRPVRGQYGIRVAVDGGLSRLEGAGTIVIPGWQGADAPVPPAIIAALRRAHARGARLLSICSGAFVLAATGLLDGARATTHWRYAETLQRRHPRVQVDPDVLYVDAGRILTSAGSAAGLDLCLHLVRRDFGPAVANLVARRLVIAPHRDGGQAQFLPAPVDRRETGSLAACMERVRARLAEPWCIADMARLAALSPRTFMRRFKAATGAGAGEWLARQRVDQARELLETTGLSVERIAQVTGLGSPLTLRRHFRRTLRLSPQQYRRRFARN
jgi:AraC family transcriptional activator FtrA